MFHVGQKVVCVRLASKPPHELRRYRLFGAIDVEVGRIYTVRSMRPVGETVGICVEEIVNPIHPFTGNEFAFNITRFRPIVERKTDISIFQRMLTSSNTKEPV